VPVPRGWRERSGRESLHPEKPYSLQLVKGRCVDCPSLSLGRIQMVSPQEGWADGWFFPTVGEGTGDHTMLHSTDGGQSWSLLSIGGKPVHQHGGTGPGPLFFFLDSGHGWVWWMDVPEAIIRLARTEDGGRTWQTRGMSSVGKGSAGRRRSTCSHGSPPAGDSRGSCGAVRAWTWSASGVDGWGLFDGSTWFRPVVNTVRPTLTTGR
jgi:hypothetical protein